MTKSFLLSKTFWFQILAVVSMVFPAVRGWVAANPEGAAAAWAAANVLLRFVSAGKIGLLSDDSPGGVAGTSAGLVGLIGMGTAAALSAFALPSCQTTITTRPDGTVIKQSQTDPAWAPAIDAASKVAADAAAAAIADALKRELRTPPQVIPAK